MNNICLVGELISKGCKQASACFNNNRNPNSQNCCCSRIGCVLRIREEHLNINVIAYNIDSFFIYVLIFYISLYQNIDQD